MRRMYSENQIGEVAIKGLRNGIDRIETYTDNGTTYLVILFKKGFFPYYVRLEVNTDSDRAFVSLCANNSGSDLFAQGYYSDFLNDAVIDDSYFEKDQYQINIDCGDEFDIKEINIKFASCLPCIGSL